MAYNILKDVESYNKRIMNIRTNQSFMIDLHIYHSCILTKDNKVNICPYCQFLKNIYSYHQLYELQKDYPNILKIQEFMYEAEEERKKYRIFKLKGSIMEFNFERENLIVERECDQAYDFENERLIIKEESESAIKNLIPNLNSNDIYIN